MLHQGLYFEVILTFNSNGLRWSSGRASRDVILQLGHIEDVVDLLKPTLKVKSICRPYYAFHYPKWAHKPRSKLCSACKIEGLRGQ